MTSVEDHLSRAEELLTKLNERRAELERLSQDEDLDADSAVDVIGELAELAKEIEGELTKARTLADAAP
jgi:hypothetical protein